MSSKVIPLFEHPDYEENYDNLVKFNDLYEGKHSVLTQAEYLWYHEFEMVTAGHALRRVREMRTRYTNFIKPFIERFSAMVYRTDLDLSNIEDALSEDVIGNVNGAGTDLESFFRNEVAKNYFLFGPVFLVVDAFEIPGEMSEEEATEAGRRPFIECVSPLQVKDWQINSSGADFGKLDAFRYEYSVIEPRTSLTEEPRQSTYCKIFVRADGGFYYSRYRLNSKHRGKAEIWVPVDEDIFVGGFDELPVVYHMGKSWIEEVADLALSLYNSESALDSQLLFQAFQRIILRGNFSEGGKMPLNEGNALLVPGEGDIVVVEPSNPVALERRIDRLLNNMFKVAFNQTRSIPTDSKAIEGAETQRESKDDFLALVMQACKDLEDLTNKSVELLFGFMGKEDQYDTEKHFISYDKKVTKQDVESEIKVIMAFREDIRRAPTWEKEVLKKVAGNMNLNDIEKIEKEIEGLVGEIEDQLSEETEIEDDIIDGAMNDANAEEGETARGATTN